MKKLFVLSVLLNATLLAQSWNEILSNTASNQNASDKYGSAVAMYGEWAVVGAPGNDYDENGLNYVDNTGTAYILKYNSSTETWAEHQKIVASDREYSDGFGLSLAIEGNTMLVGAPYEGQNSETGQSDFGAVYVFELNETSGYWEEFQKLRASDYSVDDNFGVSISIFSNYLAIGNSLDDPLDTDGSRVLNEAGSVYLFKKNLTSGLWEESRKIVAPDRSYAHEFGSAVSIYNGVLVASSTRVDNEGSVYIFNLNTLTGNWPIQQILKSDDIATDDKFGYAVSLYDDKLVCGAVWEDEDINNANTLGFAGSAYYFWYDSKNLVWTQKQKITAPIRNTADYFSNSLSLYDNSLIIGGFAEDEDVNENNTITNSGSAYIYNYNSSTKNWDFQQKVTASDREANANFGKSVAIYSTTSIVGAYMKDVSSLGDAGKSYMFEYIDPTPVELTSFTANINENTVELNWSTATEVNNYGFEVQRLQDDKISKLQDWETIGFVEGHGNSNSPKDYSFTDNLNLDLNLNLKYRLKQIDIDGQFEYSDIVEVKVELPTNYKLSQNYPNPFNPSTTISFAIPNQANVKLVVYNSLGEEVAELLNKEIDAGFQNINFDATNLSSGLYFYRITAGNFVAVKKMLLLK